MSSLRDDPPVDVVFPVLDEVGARPWVLARVPAGYRAIVVDVGRSKVTGTVRGTTRAVADMRRVLAELG